LIRTEGRKTFRVFRRITLKGGSIRPPLISEQDGIADFVFKIRDALLLGVLSVLAREFPFPCLRGVPGRPEADSGTGEAGKPGA